MPHSGIQWPKRAEFRPFRWHLLAVSRTRARTSRPIPRVALVARANQRKWVSYVNVTGQNPAGAYADLPRREERSANISESCARRFCLFESRTVRSPLTPLGSPPPRGRLEHCPRSLFSILSDGESCASPRIGKFWWKIWPKFQEHDSKETLWTAWCVHMWMHVMNGRGRVGWFLDDRVYWFVKKEEVSKCCYVNPEY